MVYYGFVVLIDLVENGGIYFFIWCGLEQVFGIEFYDFFFVFEWIEVGQDWEDVVVQEICCEFQFGDGWMWFQGDVFGEGYLFGGCVEILDMFSGMFGELLFELWYGVVMVLEISEDVFSFVQVGYWFCNWVVKGVLQCFSGLLFVWFCDYMLEMIVQFYVWVCWVLKEVGCEDLFVVVNVDFGYILFQFMLLLGVQV